MKKREALAAEVAAAIGLWCRDPFTWGRGDCFLSLADIIMRARGYDPAEFFRGRYTTARGAARVTREFGGFAGAFEFVAQTNDWREIKPKDAMIGDVGLLAGKDSPRCGVIRHEKLWVGRTLTGFAGVPVDQVARAWRVK